MSVDTTKAVGRRTLYFERIEEIVADAERVAAGPHRTLGNWSAGQIFMHLARNFDLSIDGGVSAPWPVKIIARLFLKRRLLRRPMPAGYQLPAKAATQLVPGETETEAGLAGLRQAADRYQTTRHRAPHAVLGRLTAQEWDQLHLRHAELHLSFLVPEAEPADR